LLGDIGLLLFTAGQSGIRDLHEPLIFIHIILSILKKKKIRSSSTQQANKTRKEKHRLKIEPSAAALHL
jgi:hypothetical protein